MSLLALSPAADRDITEAIDHLRRSAGPLKATRFVEGLEATGQLLLRMPKAGRVYRHTRTGLDIRAFPVSKFAAWLLFYELVGEGASRAIYVHRLLHSSRDIEALLEQD